MIMAGRRPAYRKRRHNRLGMVLATLCILMMTVVVGIGSIELKAKQKKYAVQEQALDQQIEEELVRAEELAEYEKYTRTDAFVEETAKDKLGLVYDGEIIFRSEN